jgi:hypothetical protein
MSIVWFLFCVLLRVDLFRLAFYNNPLTFFICGSTFLVIGILEYFFDFFSKGFVEDGLL